MLEKNLQEILEKIKNGNNLGEKVTLVGATKTMDIDVINHAISLGLKVVAENRVQEFNLKHELIKGAEQQFIGHLQTNKVKYLVGKVALIQSVDRIKLATAISENAIKKGVVQDILVEINVGGELSKSGFNPENAFIAVQEISKLEGLKVKGLMAMLPKSNDENLLIQLCNNMRAIYDRLKQKGYDMTYLSMGMSNDYELAINNGSNMIRLGRTIFGERGVFNGSV